MAVVRLAKKWKHPKNCQAHAFARRLVGAKILRVAVLKDEGDCGSSQFEIETTKGSFVC
jgi:hypothetical protein